MIESLPLHGGQLKSIAERFGIPLPQLIDFSANINPEGPPPCVLSAIQKSLEEPSVLSNYPDLEEINLRQSIARYAGVSFKNIIVANGFVPLLDAALHSLPIRKCLLPVPAFVEYRKALTRAKIAVTPHHLTPESNFNYNLEDVLGYGHDAILLANPQNPSGVLCNREAMLQLAMQAATQNMYVLLDEAFIDYIPEDSLAHHIESFPNLIVFRSVTKFHGIPGLRVAYAVANTDITQTVAEKLPPWSITTLASRAVCAALEDASYADRTRLLNEQRRTNLRTHIEALGISTYPSAANFLLFRLPAKLDPMNFWRRMIVEHNIVLRTCANYEALTEDHFRAAVRVDHENTHLTRIVSRMLRAAI